MYSLKIKERKRLRLYEKLFKKSIFIFNNLDVAYYMQVLGFEHQTPHSPHLMCNL